jgi:hypothetical protein
MFTMTTLKEACTSHQCKNTYWKLKQGTGNQPTSRLSITSSLTQRRNMFSPWLSFSSLWKDESNSVSPLDSRCLTVTANYLSEVWKAHFTWGSESTGGPLLGPWTQISVCTAWVAAQNSAVACREGHQAHGWLHTGTERVTITQPSDLCNPRL